MNILDHIFAAVFGVGYTAYAWISYRRIRPALVANEPGVRLRDYSVTVIWLWLLCLSAIALWLLSDRRLAALGLVVDIHWRFALAAALVIAFLAPLALQTRWIATEERTRLRAMQRLAPVREYLPRSVEELKLFFVLAVTAGVCEEVLYRGYLLWYVSDLSGQLTGVLLSSIVFGLAHLGHGYDAAVRAAVLGAVFAGLYLLSGSLWIPIALHIGIDAFMGLAGWYTRHPAPISC